jgi:acetyl-CoA carboxylase, biotin carboxylase subunit
MFQRVLVANRGEIALRVIRACKDLGVETVAVYSEADVDSLHVQLADEAICIGPAPSASSYLKIDRIISAAEIGDVDAIHPGYGFLSENAHFADICASCNIAFIGPPPSALRAMGDKNNARAAARAAEVPVTPGSEGSVETEEEAVRVAKKIGYPVMIKAVAGGGGRGMRAAHNDVSVVQGYHAARLEADKAFGNPAVYVEKLLVNPRHIEFQIMADQHGDIVHVGERDCSVQRRNQKVVEECPSPVLSDELRARMGADAVRLARSVHYVGAGTVEFLLDGQGNYYFMEMNTRIQVEHTVTEEAYGIDLVKEQVRMAAGQPLSPWVRDPKRRYHAIQCRINAEDPFDDFKPSPGRIELYYAPGGRGVRLDTHAYTGYSVPPHYDSLLAKVISIGSTRANAISRMNRALSEYIITGIKTTIPLHQAIMRHPDFHRGQYDTGFVDRIISSRMVEFHA